MPPQFGPAPNMAWAGSMQSDPPRHLIFISYPRRPRQWHCNGAHRSPKTPHHHFLHSHRASSGVHKPECNANGPANSPVIQASDALSILLQKRRLLELSKRDGLAYSCTHAIWHLHVRTQGIPHGAETFWQTKQKQTWRNKQESYCRSLPGSYIVSTNDSEVYIIAL